MLTAKQENMARVTLFHARYKVLGNDELDTDTRFAQAIIDTADHRINLTDHPEIINQWLDMKANKKRRMAKKCPIAQDK